MKKCPYCAEEIQDEAIKCKHCGEYLKKEEPVKAEVIQEAKKEPVKKEAVETPAEIKPANKIIKSKTISIILAVFAGLLIIVELQQPNFGFSAVEIGRDIWALLIYVLGGKLIYDAIKSFKK